MTNQIKVIVTGVTGMVGEGVLHECINSEIVSDILILGRKASGIQHPKVKEVVHADLFNLHSIAAQLSGYDACFFCLGTTSLGKKEAEFFKVTYTLTMHIATILSQQNSNMTFCYVSGMGTDTTARGKIMWARVKGKTENDLLKLPFKKVFNFRPSILEPTKGLKNTLGFYKYTGWLMPVIRWLLPNQISTLSALGQAMIRVAISGYEKASIEVKDIHLLAKQLP